MCLDEAAHSSVNFDCDKARAVGKPECPEKKGAPGKVKRGPKPKNKGNDLTETKLHHLYHESALSPEPLALVDPEHDGNGGSGRPTMPVPGCGIEKRPMINVNPCTTCQWIESCANAKPECYVKKEMG